MPSRRNLKASISASILIVCTAETAFAGMPSFVLRDVYRLRFQEISFFIFLLAVCAFLFQIAWNYGFAEFKSLPRLNYRRALSLSVLFGLMMLLVLTMISGIREVLTPGAWRKQGSTYRLNDPSMEPVRRRSMEHLRSALMEYARTHEGSFPRHDFVPDIPEKLWESPDHDGSRYLYSGGYSTNDGQAVIAIEPSNFGPRRLVLRGSGVISFEEEDTNPAQTAKTR